MLCMPIDRAENVDSKYVIIIKFVRLVFEKNRTHALRGCGDFPLFSRLEAQSLIDLGHVGYHWNRLEETNRMVYCLS